MTTTVSSNVPSTPTTVKLLSMAAVFGFFGRTRFFTLSHLSLTSCSVNEGSLSALTVAAPSLLSTAFASAGVLCGTAASTTSTTCPGASLLTAGDGDTAPEAAERACAERECRAGSAVIGGGIAAAS